MANLILHARFKVILDVPFPTPTYSSAQPQPLSGLPKSSTALFAIRVWRRPACNPPFTTMATTDPTSHPAAPTGIGNARTPSPVPTAPAPPPLPALQDRIQTLTELHARLATLRHVPTVLLKPPLTFSSAFDVVDSDFSVARFGANPAHDLFQTVRSVTETVRSEKVQDALRAATVSEEGDKSELGLGASILGKRGKGKRK